MAQCKVLGVVAFDVREEGLAMVRRRALSVVTSGVREESFQTLISSFLCFLPFSFVPFSFLTPFPFAWSYLGVLV